MSVRQSYAAANEYRTEFTIREGTYRNVRISEHCRPSRQALFGKELSPVRVSFVMCKDNDGVCEWIVFNAGKELYVYLFEGVGKAPDLKHYVDKRVYKTPTIPVCHDFNQMTRSNTHLDLIIGFSTGPLQLLNPLERQAVSSYNEDGSIDNSRVTCIKWVPGSEHTFVSSHRSGYLYVWDSEQTSRTTGQQNYCLHAEIQDAKIHTVKPKNKSPILFRWAIGHGAINAFAFSPDTTHIAIASQDGFMRVYDFHKHVLYSRMRSYFGGFLCVCWSPDGKYIATGGEDDLVTVWSFEHKKVMARGEGHRSYVNAVAFDPYTTVLPDSDDLAKLDEPIGLTGSPTLQSQSASSLGRSLTELGGSEREVTAYRLGSVGQDTQLCLWDLSGDALKLRRPFIRTRSRVASRHAGHHAPSDTPTSKPAGVTTDTNSVQKTDNNHDVTSNHVPSTVSKVSVTDNPVSEKKQEEESPPSISSVSSDKTSKKDKKRKSKDDLDSSRGFKNPLNNQIKKVLQFVSGNSPTHSVGSRRCQVFETCNSDDIAPKMDEVNLIEPLVAKKISQERITCLAFREDCIVTATQEGFVNTWARPGTELPPEALGEAKASGGGAGPVNAGINSPKPGSGPDHTPPIKSTAI